MTCNQSLNLTNATCHYLILKEDILNVKNNACFMLEPAMIIASAIVIRYA